jgi:PAS domain S-box-containing protein
MHNGVPIEPENLPMQRAVRGEEVREYEMDLVFKDGRVTSVVGNATPIRDEAGKPRGGIAVLMDITKRKQAEAALRESEARARQQFEELEAIYRTAPVGLCVFDRDLRYRRINARLAEINGVAVEQHIGKTVREVVPSLGSQAEEVLRRVMETRQSVRFEFSGETPAQPGAHRVWDEQWFPLWSHTGEIDGIGAVVEDITERKEFQAELQRLVDERTAKLQELVGELEHFSYTITHDLKSPLRAMRGFAELAAAMCGEGEYSRTEEFLERISTAAERMDHLIADALSYSRSVRQELPLDDVDSGVLLRGMLDSYPELQPDKARIVVQGRLPVVLANEAGLTQCFSNLLGNAVKFVKAGQIPDVRVWAEQRNGWARIWVEDKGIGIAKEMLPRVFEMFARGSNEYEGTGIGLALVRKVAQRMGGRVGVESEEGKGSRFWIELRPGGENAWRACR